MKTKSTPFNDSFDRFYMLGNIHKGKVVPHKEKPHCFFNYMEGRSVHLLAYVNGKIHIRYLPRACTQFLFDLYA